MRLAPPTRTRRVGFSHRSTALSVLLALVLLPASSVLGNDEPLPTPEQVTPVRRESSQSQPVVVEQTIEELAAEADHIFIGRVHSIQSARTPDGARIQSEVVLLVEEYLKSSAFELTLSLTVPGGTVGEVTEVVSDLPTFTVGEQVLLFLAGDEASGLRIVGGWQGAYSIQGELAAQPTANRAIPLAELKARIRATSRLPLPAYVGAFVVERSLEELSVMADRIVVANVTRVRSRVTAHRERIYTEVFLDVRQSLKGSSVSKLRLRLPGGQAGNWRELVGGVPNFLQGERVLLLLGKQPVRHIVGMWQGKYSLLDGDAVQPETRLRVPIQTIEQRVGTAIQGAVDPPETTRMVSALFTTFCVPWNTSQVPVGHFVNPANPGSGAPSGASFTSLMYDSFNAWQALSNSWVTLRIAGTTTRTYPGANDGNHDVGWGNLDDIGTGILGVNFCDVMGGTRVDSDTYFDNTGRTWSITAAPGTFDLRSISEHEFGHDIGIGHSDQPCDGTPATPLMCATIASGQHKIILADDANAAAFLYGLSGSPPSAPSSLVASGGANSVSASWTDNANDEHAFELQRASGGCGASFKAAATTPANTTSFVDDDYGVTLPNGTYCYRVKALGRGGDSGFSNTALVSIPGCNPRPNVSVTSVPAGAGRIQVTVTAGTNASTPSNLITQLSFEQANNAQVEAGGQVQSVPFVFTPSPASQQAVFFVIRQSPPGLAFTIQRFVVTDLCGTWVSLAGGGINVP